MAGVRVLDLSRVLAGPYCSMLLADLGAEVLKIERPDGGDETRGWGPPHQGDEASYYLSINRGKRSVALDLRDLGDREALLVLAEDADVVIENFKSGDADRLGVGFAAVRARNPDVVYCSITGFGSGREPQGRPGYDFLVQAETGLMAITGPPEQGPAKVGVAILDVVTGLQLGIALLAGLRAAEKSGEAQRIEVSLLDSALSALVNVAGNALATGAEPGRWGNAHPNIVPYEAFETSDGWIAVAVGNDAAFVALSEAMELEDLVSSGSYATNSDRVANRQELVELLAARFRTDTSEAWVGRLSDAGVPVGPIRGVLEALDAAEQAGESATFEVSHPTAGELAQVKSPFRFDGQPTLSHIPPPLLGEHTEEVIRDGWSAP